MPCIDCQRYSAELNDTRVKLAQAEVAVSHWEDRSGKYADVVEAVVRLMGDLDACSRHPTVDASANARLSLSLRDVAVAMRQLGLNADVAKPIVVTSRWLDGNQSG